ncbi:hypothetical protein H0H92_011012 [Tricholoma furcatifolium]|nr:hypothetical protein H0H92_011012 [Tricholoma furcatifolium]
MSDAPNPSWTYGERVDATPEGREWLEGEKAGWETVDTSKSDPRTLYKLLIGGIVPRPVAFVSTISEDGMTNIAPFRDAHSFASSWFNQVSSNPPVISISCVSLRRGDAPPQLKDTTRNILATKGFTVNIISEPWIAQSNVTSVDAPEAFSEWPVSGLTMEPSIHVRAPRVKESAFSMECELLQTVDIKSPETGHVTTTLVLGSVKYIHVRKYVLDEHGNVDPGKLKPVGRMGGTLYCKVNEGYNLFRPTWKEHGQLIQESAEQEDIERSSNL